MGDAEKQVRGALCGSRERGSPRVNAVPALSSRVSRVPLGEPRPQGRCQPVTPSGPPERSADPSGVGPRKCPGGRDTCSSGTRRPNTGGIPGTESRRGGPWAPLLMPRSPSVSAPTGEGMGAIKASERAEPALQCAAQPSPAIPCRGRGHRRSRPSSSPPCCPAGANPGWEAQAGSPSVPARGPGRGGRTAAAAQRASFTAQAASRAAPSPPPPLCPSACAARTRRAAPR